MEIREESQGLSPEAPQHGEVRRGTLMAKETKGVSEMLEENQDSVERDCNKEE